MRPTNSLLVQLIFFLSLCSWNLFAQNNAAQYPSGIDTLSLGQTLSLNALENVRTNLLEYRQQRAKGLYLAFGGTLCGIASYVKAQSYEDNRGMATNPTSEKIFRYGLPIASGAMVVVGLGFMIDADKYLDKAIIYLAPGALIVNF